MATKQIKKKGTVEPVLKKSPAQGLEADIRKAFIKVDDPKFMPQLSNGLAIIRTKDSATMPHRASATLDCGFTMTPPPGYRIVVRVIPTLADRGIVATHSIIKEARVCVHLINVGKQIVVIKPEEEVAYLSIEPEYGFEWAVLNA